MTHQLLYILKVCAVCYQRGCIGMAQRMEVEVLYIWQFLLYQFVAPFERLRGKQFSQRLAADKLYRIEFQLRIMLSQELPLCTAAYILRDAVSWICAAARGP